MKPLAFTLLALSLAAAACDDAPNAAAEDAAPTDARPGPDAQTHDAGPTDAQPPRDQGPTDMAPPDGAPIDQGTRDAAVIPAQVDVEVTLDGVPLAGARVTQGGTEQVAFTDAEGKIAGFVLDRSVVGDVVLVASHPESRQRNQWIFEGYRSPARFLMERYQPDDPDYIFGDPGEPTRRNTTAQCGHCHLRINDAWYGSAHRQAAQNPTVHDLYAGTASGRPEAEACAAVGGVLRDARLPGGGTGPRCFVGEGALPTLNADDPACANGACPAPQRTGGCADCHAPAQGGQLGGRDLLTVTGLAYDYGVSCDACHRVDRVEPEAAPGVAGRLVLSRPSEEAPASLGANGRRPLTFGPSHDSPNPRMGSVQRDHFRDGSLCVGCHDYTHGALVAGTALDLERWPTGVMPIQRTYSEWSEGPYAPGVPCNECHMPPDPIAANGSDLQAFPDAELGVQGGWLRPAGSVRRHAWSGPREPAEPKVDGSTAPARMLALAAGLFVEVTPVPGTDDEPAGVAVAVTVRNAGAGHALPTGEPMRHLVLTVEATCEGAPLPVRNGDAVGDMGGAVAGKVAGDDWLRWPEARAGDVVRVVAWGEGFYDHPTPAPFDALTPEQRGQRVEQARGDATVTAVDAEGRVTLDRPLPAGDRAWLTRPDPVWPTWAGHAGFAFGKVMVDAAGNRLAHHVQAIDIASDNRLPPLAEVTSHHVFEGACAQPQVRARLRYRPYPWALAVQRGWPAVEQVMAEVVK